MLDTIQSLIALLSLDPLTVEDVVSHLGEVDEDHGSNVIVRPRSAGFTSISVVRQYGTPEVAHVEVQLTDPIALAEVAARFGTYKTIYPDGRRPRQAIFYLPQPSAQCDIALIASIRDEQAFRIALRRDRR